jgi:arylsulfatase A-like enzyme
MKSAGLRPLTESLDVPDNAYADGASSLKTIELLKEFDRENKKFFLTVGFQKPHLPFTPPKKYWDLYERDNIKLSEFQKRSDGSPSDAYHRSGELRNYHDSEPSMDENGIVNDDKQREIIHGYMASVSFIDAQVGIILDYLKSSGMDDNTVVVFFGDHGWHLGDHGLWNKHSNFEEATRTPLIFRSPDITGGFINKSPVELLDIFPTICELAGIEVPEYLDGVSLLPILEKKVSIQKDFAISQYPRRCNVMRSVIGTYPEDCTLMGYAVRNSRYRYVAWVSGDYEDRSDFNNNEILMEELYDYDIDPLETRSFASDPKYQMVKDEMIGNLRSVIWEN